MDHSALIAELPTIEQMSTQARVQLARERREMQLAANQDQERLLPPVPQRRPRLKFSVEVALLEAAGRGDYHEVERLLADGVDPDSHNEDGLTSLHQAAIDNNARIVQLLLNHRANVNAKDTELWTPLHAAACCGYMEIVRLLIAHGADLLAINADGNMPYDSCDDEKTLDLIESEMANRGVTQEYIDEQRGLPEKEMLDDMKYLHQRNLPLDTRMPDNSTYLHIAAANGFYDVAAFLLRCGVDPTARDDDLWTPVHAAANWSQPDLIELLCEYGADINAKTKSGETPRDLTEDAATVTVIATVQHNEARKKRLAFGVRDSRRQSRKRKKFESPQPLPLQNDNPFSARGAIRRQSLRDRTGMTLARLEAQKEQSDLMRSWSKEDVSSNQYDVRYAPSASTSGGAANGAGGSASSNLKLAQHDSPKRNFPNRQQKTKPISPDEWLRKLEAESPNLGGDETEEQEMTEIRGSDGDGGGGANANGFGNFKPSSGAFRGSPTRRKQGCCCTLM